MSSPRGRGRDEEDDTPETFQWEGETEITGGVMFFRTEGWDLIVSFLGPVSVRRTRGSTTWWYEWHWLINVRLNGYFTYSVRIWSVGTFWVFDGYSHLRFVNLRLFHRDKKRVEWSVIEGVSPRSPVHPKVPNWDGRRLKRLLSFNFGPSVLCLCQKRTSFETGFKVPIKGDELWSLHYKWFVDAARVETLSRKCLSKLEVE